MCGIPGRQLLTMPIVLIGKENHTMKKVLCFILTVCITLGLCSCRRVLDTEMFVQLANMPRSTVWISENQKIQLYDYGSHGSIINNDGIPVAISLIDYSMNKGSAYLQGYIDPTSNDLKPHTYEKEKLFDFFDATVEPNGVFHLKINWCDTNGAFDESVTALNILSQSFFRNRIF